MAFHFLVCIIDSLWRLAFGLPGLTLLLALFTPPQNDPALTQTYLDKEYSESWHQYVRASSSKIIHPARILTKYSSGNVTNAEGIINGGGLTILTRTKAADEKPSIVIDFGRNTAGIIQIDFAGSTNFTTARPGLRLAYSETLQFLSDRSDFSRSYNGDTITPGTDQIAVQKKPYSWISQLGCQHRWKVCSDGLHGFRYLKIYLDALHTDAPYTSSLGSVSISSITLQLSAFHGTPETFTGWFESSDRELNQWWYDSVYTNDLCTDVFRKNDTEPRNAWSPTLEGKLVLHDGVKRDRDPYAGDLAVASKTSYLSHDVSVASRNVLADLAEHQRSDGWIPPASIVGYRLPLLDYPLYWVTCSYDYLMHTNDTDYIEKYYPVLRKVLNTYYPSITNKTTHLITKGINNSNGYGDYAFLPRTGAVTYFNALYVLALKNAAFIADHIHQTEDSANWIQRANSVSHALNKYRFDDHAGAFFDGDCGSTPCQTHAQDGNALSIVSGAVPANSTRAKSILHHLTSKHARAYGNAFYDNDRMGGEFSQRVYAFISYFEIEARFLAGEADTALEEIRRLYGWMASQDPGVTVWEGIGKDGEPYEGGFTSMSHGWSTGIVPLLINHILGVRASDVGFKRWAVKPMIGGLKWARGAVPTPYGKIEVVWDTKGGGIEVVVNAPEGTSGIVSVPAGAEMNIRLDGAAISRKLLLSDSETTGFVGVEVGSGRHVISSILHSKDEV